jgi:anti-sigma B factor antagonist
MRITEDSKNDVTVLNLEGDFDAATAPEVETKLRTLYKAGRSRLVLDLSGVPYISSAGLRVLQMTLLAARSRSGDLRLAALSTAVREVLDMAGFTPMFEVFDDTAAAVQSFQDAPGAEAPGAESSP